jgi:dCTP deaminase
MQLLGRKQFEARRKERSPDRRLYIDPLLDENQIGEVTIDLRLGYDFMVSILTRKPYIGLDASDDGHRSTHSYFRMTRRELGERFILYPSQVVLATTLEYIAMPSDVYADVLSRSSYTRLGVHMNSMVQPGYRGCITLELFNHGNNALELIVGSRICQARLFEIDGTTRYQDGANPRKYYGNVRPTPSRASMDRDVERLAAIRRAGLEQYRSTDRPRPQG